jgi:hypothetical protein
MQRTFIGIALFSLLAVPASAQQLSAVELNGMCLDPIRQAACGSYVEGFLDGLSSTAEGRRLLCLPQGGSTRQYAAAYHEFLGDQPSMRTGPARSAFAAMLLFRFGCQPN